MKTRKAITMMFVAALLLGAAGGVHADVCNGGCGGGHPGSGGGGLPGSSGGPQFFLSDGVVGQGQAQREGAPAGGVTEGQTCELTLKLKNGKKPASVHYATKNASASSEDDYTAKEGDITIDPKEGNPKAPIFVQTSQDSPEKGNGDETFFVVLSNAHNATIADGKGKCVIHQLSGPTGPTGPPQ